MNADEFNASYPGVRPEKFPSIARRLDTRTRSRAWELGHGAAVVSVDGYGGGIALTHVDVIAATTDTATGDLIDPNGTTWRRTRHTRNGEALYLIDGKDPETVRPWVMSTAAQLADIFGEPMTPLDGAA